MIVKAHVGMKIPSFAKACRKMSTPDLLDLLTELEQQCVPLRQQELRLQSFGHRNGVNVQFSKADPEAAAKLEDLAKRITVIDRVLERREGVERLCTSASSSSTGKATLHRL